MVRDRQSVGRSDPDKSVFMGSLAHAARLPSESSPDRHHDQMCVKCGAVRPQDLPVTRRQQWQAIHRRGAGGMSVSAIARDIKLALPA
jgi:hypothetical protein